MQSEEVLELIRSAPERYDTVRAALRYRADGPTKKEIRERLNRSEAGRRAFGDTRWKDADELPVRAEPINHPEPDGPFGWRCWAWYAGKRRWRLERELPDEGPSGGGIDIKAVNAGRLLEHRTGGGSRSNDPRWFSLALDPYWTFYALATQDFAGVASELENLDLTVESQVAWAGRKAVRLVGVPGARWRWDWDPDPLSWGADEYEVVVDAERGVLLRCASRLGGTDFDALEVEEIHFDEEFPEGTFSAREPLPWP